VGKITPQGFSVVDVGDKLGQSEGFGSGGGVFGFFGNLSWISFMISNIVFLDISHLYNINGE